MNANVETKVRAEVRWNALEITILSNIYPEDPVFFSGTKEYTREQLLTINGDIADELDPEADHKTPRRLREEDHTGTVPVKHLFEKTETLIANVERAEIQADTFRYDPDAEL